MAAGRQVLKLKNRRRLHRSKLNRMLLQMQLLKLKLLRRWNTGQLRKKPRPAAVIKMIPGPVAAKAADVEQAKAAALDPEVVVAAVGGMAVATVQARAAVAATV